MQLNRTNLAGVVTSVLKYLSLFLAFNIGDLELCFKFQSLEVPDCQLLSVGESEL